MRDLKSSCQQHHALTYHEFPLTSETLTGGKQQQNSSVFVRKAGYFVTQAVKWVFASHRKFRNAYDSVQHAWYGVRWDLETILGNLHVYV